MLVPVAAADGLAERSPLERETAPGTHRRQHAGLDEQGTHQRHPQERVDDDPRATHACSYRQEGPNGLLPFAKIDPVSWLYIALLVLAIAVVIGAEWPRLGRGWRRASGLRRAAAANGRSASRRSGSSPDDADDFAASVERDLAQLPTIEETDRR